MIDCKHIPDLIKKNKTPYLRIYDGDENIIYVIENDKMDQTIREFEQAKEILCDHRRIIIHAATKSQYNSNYRGSFHWECTFDREAARTPVQGIANTQANSQLLAMSIKLEELKFAQKLEKKERELEEKYNKKNKGGFEEWMPLIDKYLGKFLKMEPGELSNNLNPGSSLAGPSTRTKTKLSAEMTKEELQEAVDLSDKKLTEIYTKIGPQNFQRLAAGIYELTERVDIDVINELIEGLSKKPEIAKTALTFL